MARTDDIRTGWSVSGSISKGVAGTFGIIAALVIDYIQKGNDSALLFATHFINDTALTRFDIASVPPLAYAGALVVAGFALVHIFEPASKINAFYAGAGILGFLATFSPVKQDILQVTPIAAMEDMQTPEPAPLPGEGETGAIEGNAAPAMAPDGAQSWSAFPVMAAGFRPLPNGSQVVNAQMTGIPVSIAIQFPADQGTDLPEVRAWLHDNVTGETSALTAGATLVETSDGPRILYETVIATGEPQDDLLADLEVRVEADGYAITEAAAPVTSTTELPVTIELVLERSNTPVAIQRLLKPSDW